MDISEKIIENPLFFKWIFKSNQEVDKYWEEYMSRNPEETDKINELKSLFNKLDYSYEKLSVMDKKELSIRIQEKLTNADNKQKRKKLAISLMRYAAVALMFFSLGGILVYLQMNKQERRIYAEQFAFPSQLQEPTLIIPESGNIQLKKSESSLDYSNSGEIIVNEDSIIKSGNAVNEPLIQHLVIPYGNRSKVVLSDGTTVWVNAGSRLIYPSAFKGNNREVVLFGEAFFDVARNEELPFIVRTSDLDVKVLGTKFNVSAYPDDNIVQTVLKEGSVSIRRTNAQFYEQDIVLKPNQLVSYNKKTNESKIYNVDANYYSIWTQGLLSFDEIDLSRVIKKIERFYNISVSYSDPLLGNIKISGKLDLSQNRDEVFEYLAKVSLTHFEKTGDNSYRIKK